MLEWMHDEDVVRDLKANFTDKTLEDCERFIEAAQDLSENIHLAITDDNDKYMGTVSLKHINGGKAEFGISIRKCAMGKGLSRLGMSEIIRLGFEEYGLDEVYWCVDPVNKRAVRFYDKNGYKRCSCPVDVLGYSDEEKERFCWYSVKK